MNTLTIPCPTGGVSDGYHTFDELYAHRCLLFLALMQLQPTVAWISNMHHDGSSWEGWFIAGLDLPSGPITYHMPNKLWPLANRATANFRRRAPEWDGHTSGDVLDRLELFIENQHGDAPGLTH